MGIAYAIAEKSKVNTMGFADPRAKYGGATKGVWQIR